MSIISECLRQILSARYGRDVRQAIHDGIQQCYYDGKAGSIDLQARQDIEALKDAKDITSTTSTTMPNSYSGRLLVDEIVGECQQESTAGKNLLDCSGLTTTTTNGVTFTPVYAENGALEYVNVNGTATADTYYRISTKNTLSVGKYIANGSENGGTATHKLIFYNAPNSFLQTNIPVTFELTSAISNQPVDINVSSGITVTNVKFYPMIRKASIEDATYEPYTNGASPNPSYPQEIKKTVVSEVKTHGVQMLPSKITLNNTGLSAIIDEQNRIVLSGTTKDTAAADLYVYGEWGGDNDLGVRGQISIGTNLGNAYLLHKNTIVAMSLAGSAINRNITDDNYITAIMVRFPANTTCNGVLELMLNEGSEAFPYEPYTESAITLSQPIDLHGKGDVQDAIGDGKIKGRFAEVIFDGSDDEAWVQNQENWFYTSVLSRKIKIVEHNAFPNILATHLSPSSREDLQKKINQICISTNGNLNAYIDCADLNSFKSLLASNPMTVVYEMAEEVIEELPIADQIALNSLSTYDGITYLEFDSEIEPTFKGEYGTSKVGGYTLEGMLAGRNGELYGSRITALEASAVNNI